MSPGEITCCFPKRRMAVISVARSGDALVAAFVTLILM
jgi:hypothetical protein